MEKIIYPHIEESERENHLEAMADEVLDGYIYSRELSDEELGELYVAHAEMTVDLSRLQERLRTIQDEFKTKMTPLKNQIGEMVLKMKTRRVTETGTCFKLVDEEERQVGIYSASGYLIEQRPAWGNDLQRNLFRDVRSELRVSKGERK